MKRLLVALVVVMPSIALAQPVGGAPDPYPAPPPDPGQPPPPPEPQPPPVYQPPPPPPQPLYQPPPGTWQFHKGVTFEANLGLGFVHFTDQGGTGQSLNTDLALAGLDLGVGGWVSPNMAVTARVAGLNISDKTLTAASTGNLIILFFGPSLQYWSDEHLWFGAGVGLARLAFIGGNSSSTTTDNGINGLGLDLRAGYTFGGSTAHTFNLSVELTPGFYSGQNGSSGGTGTGASFLAGYQFL